MTTGASPLERPLDIRKDIKVSPELNEKIEALMFALGIKTKTQALERLLGDFTKSNPQSEESKIASFSNVMNELAPVCVYGLPGDGKSWTLKKLVAETVQSGISVIIIDVANEHGDILDARKVSATSAISRRFKQGIYRIVPDKDPRQREFSIQRIFEHLNTLAFKRKLLNFSVFIDEGNELKEIKEVQDFLIESRKFVKKAVIVSADPEPYNSVCKSMRPFLKTKNVLIQLHN